MCDNKTYNNHSHKKNRRTKKLCKWGEKKTLTGYNISSSCMLMSTQTKLKRTRSIFFSTMCVCHTHQKDWKWNSYETFSPNETQWVSTLNRKLMATFFLLFRVFSRLSVNLHASIICEFLQFQVYEFLLTIVFCVGIHMVNAGEQYNKK